MLVFGLSLFVFDLFKPWPLWVESSSHSKNACGHDLQFVATGCWGKPYAVSPQAQFAA